MPPRRKSPRGKAAANPPGPNEDKKPSRLQTAPAAYNLRKPGPLVNAAAAATPDPTNLSNAFDQVVAHMRSQQHRDLKPHARDWLADAVSKVINKLKRELQDLHRNRDNPVLYPDYVLDCSRSMNLYVSTPFALTQYHDQFEHYLLQMLRQCGFSATSSFSGWYGYANISLHIKFPAESIKDETKTIKNRIFDVRYHQELLLGIKNLRIAD